MSDKSVEILDSTLRDGAQGEGISFSVQDKIHICQALDDLGVAFIEAGNPGSNPKDMEFFQEMKRIPLASARLCAFGSTRRKEIRCAEDANLQSLLAADTEWVVIFGKSWTFQVTDIIRTTLEENLAMIRDTCAYLRENGRRVIYDAEHFFTGFQADREYALKTLGAAADGGAEVLSLCETKGGCMLSDCREAVSAVVAQYAGRAKIGIHAHNDSGLAVANSLVAVEAGARHVQGTLLGFGERTGNANLSCIIPDLQLKMGFSCISAEKLAELTPIAKRVAEITNIALNPQLPFVGGSAFSHKAGMHIDAVLKNPAAYEHIAPESVGNARVFLMSEVAGRSTIIEKVQKIDPSVKKDDPVVSEIVQKMKQLEFEGYQFEGADGSFELLMRRLLGRYRPFFKLHYYQTNGVNPRPEEGVCACAQIKLEVDGQIEVTAGEGDGPVNALDIALRKALCRFYPAVSCIRLTDYKVRVLDGKSATAARVRVLIESSDGDSSWTTVGVSSDVMEASWLALCDSFEYKLIKDIERHLRRG
ncbi:MAG: citramalate synthase [Treponemataceae bacterium]|nr:citramalate synthase [Treponemataceae bacterium]